MNEKSRGIQMTTGYIGFSMFDPFLEHITLPVSRYFIHTVCLCILYQYLCVCHLIGLSVYLCTCVLALQRARLFSSAKFRSTVWGFHLRRTDTGHNYILSMFSSLFLILSATGTPLINTKCSIVDAIFSHSCPNEKGLSDMLTVSEQENLNFWPSQSNLQYMYSTNNVNENIKSYLVSTDKTKMMSWQLSFVQKSVVSHSLTAPHP